MVKKILNWKLIFLFIGTSFFINTIIGQDDKEILVDLVKEEQEAVNAIVLYPEETRNAILKASLHPDALIKMESIQSKTRKSFIELLEDYTQKEQEEVWDLSRYPGLINALVITPESEIDEALEEYPEVIHKRAKNAVSNNYNLLNRVDELDFIAESAYSSLIKEYPDDVQNALNHLIGQPEVLTILMDNIRLTVLVGKMYDKDPQWLLSKVDSLHLQLAKVNAKELDDWKQSLEENPESAKQLQEVSEQYKEENNYYDDDYYEYERRDQDITVNYYNYHYPYWFGYPSWYTYPRWRIHPYWYDWGFYYGPHNRIIFIGMPSYHFTYWYFERPHHHHHYNHLSAHFANHYYGHRNSTGSVTASVTQWRDNNREVVSERWIKEDGNLKNRFQEFGRAEVQRAEYNRENPRNKVSQSEFIVKNKSKYPGLAESAQQVKSERGVIRETTKKTKVTKTTKTQSRPIKTTPRKTKTKVEPTLPKNDNRRKSNISNKRVIEQKTRTIPTTKKARDYHKSTWEKTTTKRTKIKQPRTTVKKTPVSKRPTKKRIPVKKKSKGN